MKSTQYLGERGENESELEQHVIRVHLPFCVTSMEQAHFWSHQHLSSHCVRNQWMMVVESLRIKNFNVCIDALHELKRPQMFKVARDVSFLATKATFSGLTRMVTIFWNSGRPLQYPDDRVIPSTYHISGPMKINVFKKGHSFKVWILSLNHCAQVSYQRRYFDVIYFLHMQHWLEKTLAIKLARHHLLVFYRHCEEYIFKVLNITMSCVWIQTSLSIIPPMDQSSVEGKDNGQQSGALGAS